MLGLVKFLRVLDCVRLGSLSRLEGKHEELVVGSRKGADETNLQLFRWTNKPKVKELAVAREIERIPGCGVESFGRDDRQREVPISPR
jgi:hypothetical protein